MPEELGGFGAGWTFAPEEETRKKAYTLAGPGGRSAMNNMCLSHILLKALVLAFLLCNGSFMTKKNSGKLTHASQSKSNKREFPSTLFLQRMIMYCVYIFPLALLISETQSVTDRRKDTVNYIYDYNITLCQYCKTNANTIHGVNVMKINSEFPCPIFLQQRIYWNETSEHPLVVINQTHSAE
jgi:hypothetical protein